MAGNPASYFHKPSVSAWLNAFSLTPDANTKQHSVLDEIFAAAICQGTLDTGMFGLRLQRPSFGFFIQQLAILRAEQSSDAMRFQSAFGRTAFVHLTRTDKVEQAVSCLKAEQTGLWHVAPDGTELERVSEPQSPIYDPGRIGELVKDMDAYDQLWVSWFSQEDIDPIRITYESLSAQPNKTLCGLLEKLGLDCEAASKVKPGIAKMADAVNQEWVTRFRATTQ